MSKKNLLVGFLNLLEDNRIFTFDIDSKESRKKLQKYVYLTMFFRSNFKYSYNLYINGPYSPSLANDYYSLEGVPPEIPEIDKRYIELIEGRDGRWLELASTLLYFKRVHPNISDNKLVMRTRYKKSFSTEDELRLILSELRDYNII